MQTDIHVWLRLAQFFLEWEMFQTKVVQKIKTGNFLFFCFANQTVIEGMCENIVVAGSPQTTIRRMRTAYWIPKATDIHSEYAIFIAFLCSRACTNAPSVLRAVAVLIVSFELYFSHVVLYVSKLGVKLNLLMPNANYSWRTAPLTSKVAFYIFIQQI